MTLNRRSFLGGALTASSAIVVAGCRTSSGKPASVWPSFSDALRQQSIAGTFSGAVRVEQNGQVLLDAAFGMADRTRHIANTPTTKFCAASMGKMFTAVAIGQLVSAHKVAFDDTVGKHLPGFPSAIADHVTVAQLLTHTSGMGDVFQHTGPTPPPDTLTGQIAQIATTPLLFAPGSSSAYSNSGFVVLGAIVQQASGTAYPSYIHDHVFAPAGMSATDIRVYRPADVPGMAHGYELDDASGRPDQGPPPGPGQNPVPAGDTFRDNAGEVQIGNPSGGAISTTGDLARFARALITHQLLDPAMTATLTTGKVTVHRPGGPAQDSYAYGFEDVRINGVRVIGHNGGTPGYEGQLDIYPDTGTAVAIMCNQDRALVPAIQRTEAMLTGSAGAPTG
ncbi:serine hydrolase domain-containing protein [Catenulispora sp. EB89]|uniref:serine hydrolase domain-containing protein n=1 Tax=Catenulispora sp. EB89 TaxID=3156257 RepID=UPI0035128A83